MKKITAGILAHVDSGKTTLAEAMLYTSGSINKLGRVDRGSSFLDSFYLERKRGITIFSKQAMMKFNGCEFTLLDTPGHADFSAETERTLQVLDYAILVISAPDGVQSHTLTLWELLKKYRVPCFIFINKTDLDGADKALAIGRIKNELSDGAVDFSEENRGFFESIALCDDDLFEKYSKNGSLLKNDIVNAIKKRKIFPCVFGSALKLDGVEEFLNILDKYTEMPEYKKQFGAKVYKISQDKNGGRLTHLKITGGELKVKDILQSKKNTTGEKVNQIRLYSGGKFTAVEKAEAGTVCAVTGITFAEPGDGIGAEKDSALPILEPVLTYRVSIDDKTDAHTVFQKFKILEEEDPQLKAVWNENPGEIQIHPMGGIQLEVLKSIMESRFGINVSFGRGSIIYKETIENTVEGIGHFEPLRHYAEVHLLLKPKERGSGLVFRSECKEDVLAKNWQRLIITHLYEKTHIGVLTGSPVTDMEIILMSGRAHPKHTEGGDFRQATYRAVRQGLMSAKSVLLEPYYNFTLEIPAENTGRAISDIQRMSGKFSPAKINGNSATITGTAPVSEMIDYQNEVVKYTHGAGRLVCSFKGYDTCHNAQEVIEKTGYDPQSDTLNPCDSVFCSHGAGYIVKWNEVKSHMHLPSVLSRPKTEYEKNAGKMLSFSKEKKNIFALDKELMQIFEKTYGPVKKKTAPQAPSSGYFGNAKKEHYRRKDKRNYDGREYLLVDGYNVIFSWDELRDIAKTSIDAARNTLVNILCNYQGYKKCEVILVFDAYKVKGNSREVEKIDNISVVYTKEAETADTYIEKTSHELAKNNKVRVVTSDALEQIIILGSGALRVSSREFKYEVEQAEEEIKSIIENKNG